MSVWKHAISASRIAVILRCPCSVWRWLAALALDMRNTFNACVPAKTSYLSFWLDLYADRFQRTKFPFSDAIFFIRTWYHQWPRFSYPVDSHWELPFGQILSSALQCTCLAPATFRCNDQYQWLTSSIMFTEDFFIASVGNIQSACSA